MKPRIIITVNDGKSITGSEMDAIREWMEAQINYIERHRDEFSQTFRARYWKECGE